MDLVMEKEYEQLRQRVKLMKPADLTYKGYFAEGFDAGFAEGHAIGYALAMKEILGCKANDKLK